MNVTGRWKPIFWKYQNGKCYYCGRKMNHPYDKMNRRRGKVSPPNAPTWDHIIPKSKGGRNTVDNIHLVCYDCNTKKGADILPKKTMPKVKVLKMREVIQEHDFLVKVKHAKDWIKNGNLVRVIILKRGKRTELIDLELERKVQHIKDELGDVMILFNEPAGQN